MRYLLINHIAATPGTEAAQLSFPAAWASELTAAGRVAREFGLSLSVASPLESKPHRAGARVELMPDASGFEHVPLPAYRSARGFLRCRAQLDAALATACNAADVVQLDAGGYPMPLGVVASEHAVTLGKRSIWTVVGEPPASTLAGTANSVAKRAVGRHVDARVGRTLYDAIRECTHVVTTTEQSASRLLAEHDVVARWIDVLDLYAADVADSRTIAVRHAAMVDPSRTLRLVVVGPHTVSRGTANAIRAIARSWKLRVPVELTIAGPGSEVPMLRALAGALGVGPVVRFEEDVDAAVAAADVWVDPSTESTPASRSAANRAMASGLAPIVATSAAGDSPIRSVAPTDVGALAAAIFDAAARRDALAARMLAGVEWCRARTIESAYRRRFELVTHARRHSRKAAA